MPKCMLLFPRNDVGGFSEDKGSHVFQTASPSILGTIHFTKPVSISSTHMPRAAHEVTLPKPLAGSPSAISYHEEGVGEELTRHNEIRPITRTK